MADNTFDPKQLAEYQALLGQVDGILQSILEKDTSIARTQAQIEAEVQRRRASLEANLQITFQQAEASGKLLDNEQRRSLLLQQHRENLQKQLATLTTEYYRNEQELSNVETRISDINTELGTLSANAQQNTAKINALTSELVAKESRRTELKRTTLNLDEAERKAIVGKITAEMQYTDAKMKSTQAAQSAMSMLFGLDNKWRQTLAGSLTETFLAARRATNTVQALGETAAHLTQTLSNVGSAGNMIGSSLMKVQEVTIKMVGELDRADVSFRSLTGNARGFEGEIYGAFEDKEIRAMAGAMGEVAQAQGALVTYGRQYVNVNSQMRMEMTRTAIAAKRMGIDFDTTAKIMDRSNRLFGITGPEMMSKLHSAAIAVGDSPKRVVQQFNESLDVLAQYSGPRAMQVFQSLVAISKQTAVGMGNLISVANQFDTFETAAGSVAKLNAIMGGAYFNSVQMLNASEERRLQLLRAGLDATNRSWQSLGRFEKKALAAAAGFRSLEEAGAFFTGDMAKVEEMTRAQEQQVATQQKLWQAASQVVGVTEKMARIFQDAGFQIERLLRYARGVVGVFEDIGFEGILLAKVLFGVVNSFSGMVVQTRMLAGLLPGAASGIGLMGASLMRLVPVLGLAAAAWMYFSSKMSEEKSPAAWQLPSIAAQGISALGESAKKAATPVSNLANKVGTINDGKIVSLTRALGAASQLSAPDLNFSPAVAGFSEISRAVNNLDEEKINSFSMAMARLGATMKMIPKENVVAVTQLTKEARSVSALPIAAAARQGAQVSAQGAAVRAARASAAPSRGGGGGGGGEQGILVTDSITLNVGGTVLTQTIKEVARNEYRRAKLRRG
jgi:hypothetical protein